RENIDEYDVVFWHRLLKTIYQEPLEMECELHVRNQAIKNPETAILRRLDERSKWQILKTTEETAIKIQSGEIKPLPVNWKYFIKLPSGGIIEIGTKDQHTVLYFAHVISGQVKDEDSKQTEKFIALLLEEAKKESRNKLFDPLKEFKKTDGLKFYHLFNVYLANYVSAEFMLGEAVTQEKVLRDEFLKYDARISDLYSDLYDEEKRKHIDQFMLACGMYYLSAITYFFMSLEGFINIVFHSFQKENLRDRDLNIEERFDIEQKLKLMTALCNGFIQKSTDSTDDIYSKFLKLKKYRNNIFHSKVEDSLKGLLIIEDGFLYSCDMSKYKEQFLPAQKMMLSANDVIEVKNIVDGIIRLVLNSMTDDTRLLTEKYILKSTPIPFYILKDGSLSLGKSDREQNGNDHAQQANPADGE
ncbi:MAG: hypothetical protein Q8M92_03295, partial [Candidatus Subteraquimicrobiales bacterium]|nr:hypothetical protein [Candidatus Subteraquimicrobiales bacterium]